MVGNFSEWFIISVQVEPDMMMDYRCDNDRNDRIAKSLCKCSLLFSCFLVSCSIFAWQSEIRVRLKSLTEFLIAYFSGCDFTIDISKNPTSTINFPGYTTPAKYPAGVVCSWLIQDPNTVKKSINLEFADFNLATGDYIQVDLHLFIMFHCSFLLI